MKPLISLFLVWSFLFLTVFIKMENRRLGYEALKLYQKEKQAREEKRQKMAELARLNSPERIRRVATRIYNYKKARKEQVIRVAAKGTAVIQ